jgi:hypothetical protein
VEKLIVSFDKVVIQISSLAPTTKAQLPKMYLIKCVFLGRRFPQNFETTTVINP